MDFYNTAHSYLMWTITGFRKTENKASIQYFIEDAKYHTIQISFLGDPKYLVTYTYLYLCASSEFFTPAFGLLVIKQL